MVDQKVISLQNCSKTETLIRNNCNVKVIRKCIYIYKQTHTYIYTRRGLLLKGQTLIHNEGQLSNG